MCNGREVACPRLVLRGPEPGVRPAAAAKHLIRVSRVLLADGAVWSSYALAGFLPAEPASCTGDLFPHGASGFASRALTFCRQDCRVLLGCRPLYHCVVSLYTADTHLVLKSALPGIPEATPAFP